MSEQPWSDDPVPTGRIVVVTDNPIARAILGIADTVGRSALLLSDDPMAWIAENSLGAADSLVLCDHDEPDAVAMLTIALAGGAGYVAMMGSRRRAATLFADLETYVDEQNLARLHVPAGLNIGGRSPGDIALSVMAELVAVSHGRSGGPMRTA